MVLSRLFLSFITVYKKIDAVIDVRKGFLQEPTKISVNPAFNIIHLMSDPKGNS